MKRKFLRQIIFSLIIISYLGIFFANVYHFHNYTFSINFLAELENGQSKTNKIWHSFELCPVSLVFNSIHHFLGKIHNLNFQDVKLEKLLILESTNLKRFDYLVSQNFRAPPENHS